MGKPLTQITFEFSPAEETSFPPAEEVAAPVIVAEKEMEQVVTPPSENNNVTPKKTGSTRGRRSLKDIAPGTDLIQVPEDEVLFQKQYYSIGEVAAMFRENQSLIRYWETEFDILKPRKNRKGDRFFRPVDIKNLVMIYDLLRRRKFTIEGAKEYLKKNKKAEEKFEMIQSLQKIRSFLLELKASL
jgi:DNA-binding transcriptional MerR regulator